MPDPARARRWAELDAEQARALATQLGPIDEKLRIIAQGSPRVLHALALHARGNGATLLLIPADATAEKVEEYAQRIGATHMLSEAEGEPRLHRFAKEARSHSHSGLGILTSGTTGEPKLAWHSWQTVAATAGLASARLPHSRWLMAYAPHTYAAVQVLFASIESSGSIVYPSGDLSALHHEIVEANVEAVSATPTWWRRLVLSWPADLARPALRQATLGGEAATQDVLDLVSSVFSPRRITHVYASTEAGAAMAVSDGREGFPTTWLSKSGPVQVRVCDGQLEIRSQWAMRGYDASRAAFDDEGWYRTPDLAEIRGDRILVTGRTDGVINVGGRKLIPEQVESALRTVSGILDAVVYAKRSPITGYVLAADVILDNEDRRDGPAVRNAIRAVIDPSLVPSVVRVVDSIASAPSGKKMRIG